MYETYADLVNHASGSYISICSSMTNCYSSRLIPFDPGIASPELQSKFSGRK